VCLKRREAGRPLLGGREIQIYDPGKGSIPASCLGKKKNAGRIKDAASRSSTKGRGGGKGVGLPAKGDFSPLPEKKRKRTRA